MDFTEIALNKLTSTFPELGPYVVSFQNFEEEVESESGIKAGMFIVRVGQSLLFIPVVAKGENIYPIDSIFNPESGKFFPLSKKSVKNIVNGSSEVGVATKSPNTLVKNPSIYNLVNPPKTGKFVYASEATSKMPELLSKAPDMVKEAFEKALLDDPILYQPLHKMFGMDLILSALKRSGVKPQPIAQPTVKVITDGEGLNADQVVDIVEKGYAIVGNPKGSRIAYSAESYNVNGEFQEIGSSDAGSDYDFVLKDGSTVRGFLAGMKTKNHLQGEGAGKYTGPVAKELSSSIAILKDGRYICSDKYVVNGGRKEHLTALPIAFHEKGHSELKDLYKGDTAVIVTDDLKVFGPFNVEMAVRTDFGCTLNVHGYTGIRKITSSVAYKATGEVVGDELLLPATATALLLDKQTVCEQSALMARGKAAAHNPMDIFNTATITHHDGVFSYNRKPVGGAADLMKILVIQEDISPSIAEGFMKQAKEDSSMNLYLSKQAEMDVGGEIPSYGTSAGPQINPLGVPNDGESVNNRVIDIENIRLANQLGNPDVTGTAVILELLQNPYMYDLINEFLPEIETAIDRMGRLLLVVRLKISALSKTNSADEVFSFASQLRSVYKMMGETYLKLKVLGALGNEDKAE